LFSIAYDEAATIVWGDRRFHDLSGRNWIAPRDRPQFAASHTGDVYATPGGAYEVVAKSSEGVMRWALRVATTPKRFEPRDYHFERFEARYEFFPARMKPPRENIRWPEFEPVIDRIDVDAEGNLYVFPWTAEEPIPGSLRPVDVYSRDGRLLWNAMIPEFDWQDAQGDYVYGVTIEPEDGTERAVRYRLTLPSSQVLKE